MLFGGEANEYRTKTTVFERSSYATLGVFLILAAKDPLAHASLIWFVVWSSVVHGLIMLIHAIVDEMERGHLIGDVPALFLVAAILAYLMPRKAASRHMGSFARSGRSVRSTK